MTIGAVESDVVKLAQPVAIEADALPASVRRDINSVLSASSYDARSRALEVLMVNEELWRGPQKRITRAELLAMGNELEQLFPTVALTLREAIGRLLIMVDVTQMLGIEEQENTTEAVFERIYGAETLPEERRQLVAFVSGLCALVVLERAPRDLFQELADRFLAGCRAGADLMYAEIRGAAEKLMFGRSSREQQRLEYAERVRVWAETLASQAEP